MGYHLQGNLDGFLSTDFGLPEWNALEENERIRRYQAYVYEAGAIGQPDQVMAKPENESTGAGEEQKKPREITKSDRFRHRTRYFTDSAVIGSREFVADHFERFAPNPSQWIEDSLRAQREFEAIAWMKWRPKQDESGNGRGHSPIHLVLTLTISG